MTANEARALTSESRGERLVKRLKDARDVIAHEAGRGNRSAKFWWWCDVVKAALVADGFVVTRGRIWNTHEMEVSW